MTPQPTSFTYPTRTKVIIAVVVAIAIGGFVLAGMSADTDNADDIALSGGGGSGGQVERDADGVIRTSPRDKAQALAQEELRIQLSAGWTGELILLPSSGAAIPLPDDEVEKTALNELVYVPEEGRTVERLPSGRSCVRATIWDQVEGRDASERVYSWCFDVT
jgi:hypothetical protein